MRISSPIRRKHARIEIIPLIDVMVFLLASFMMVSLKMTRVENIRVILPSATQVSRDFAADMFHIVVDKTGATWVEKKKISLADLYTALTNRHPKSVFIGGDADTLHGDMVQVLDIARRAGVQRIAFTVTPEQAPAAPL